MKRKENRKEKTKTEEAISLTFQRVNPLAKEQTDRVNELDIGRFKMNLKVLT